MPGIRLAGALLLAALLSPTARTEPVTAGPLVHEFELTLMPGLRTESVGPLFHYEVADLWEQWAVSPFLSYTYDRGIDGEGLDFLYPFITYDRFGEEYRLRFFLLTTLSGGEHQSGDRPRRFTIFPFIFRQWSTTPEREYWALFPLGGTIRDRLFRDEIRFALFPLFARTRRGDAVTENYLYPIFHWRHGPGLRGWQFFPLAGYEERASSVITNRYGDAEIRPGHRKTSVLWPVYFRNDLGLGTTNPVSQRLLLPLYARERSPARDSSTWLWPLFTYTEDRARQYREWDMPWPLVVFARGEGKTANRVWPFYSRVRGGTLESAFYAWPIYKYNRQHSPPFDRERTRILFFLYSQVTERNEELGTTLRRWDLWPLFSRRANPDGTERLQVLALVEPLLPRNEPIQRNYSPLWSLWRSERNEATGASSQSLLWNLYRRDVKRGGQRSSAMFGLFQYEAKPTGKRLRLFYLPSIRLTKGAPVAAP
jgi:hypothetical protein